MSSKTSRTSFTLPHEVRSDLTFLSSRLGVSRSSLLAELLQEPLHNLRELVEAIPPSPTPADLLRFKGASESVIRQRIDSLKGMTDDLFSK
jgi:hypothetical protein